MPDGRLPGRLILVRRGPSLRSGTGAVVPPRRPGQRVLDDALGDRVVIEAVVLGAVGGAHVLDGDVGDAGFPHEGVLVGEHGIVVPRAQEGVPHARSSDVADGQLIQQHGTGDLLFPGKRVRFAGVSGVSVAHLGVDVKAIGCAVRPGPVVRGTGTDELFDDPVPAQLPDVVVGQGSAALRIPDEVNRRGSGRGQHPVDDGIQCFRAVADVAAEHSPFDGVSIDDERVVGERVGAEPGPGEAGREARPFRVGVLPGPGNEDDGQFTVPGRHRKSLAPGAPDRAWPWTGPGRPRVRFAGGRATGRETAVRQRRGDSRYLVGGVPI